MISKISYYEDYNRNTQAGMARYLREKEQAAEKTFMEQYVFTEEQLEDFQKDKEEEKHRSDGDDFFLKYVGVRRPNGSVGAIAYAEATDDNKDQHILNSSMIEEAEMAGLCDAPGQSQGSLTPAAAGGIELTKDQLEVLDGKFDLADKDDKLERLAAAYDLLLRQDKLLVSDLEMLTSISGQIADLHQPESVVNTL